MSSEMPAVKPLVADVPDMGLRLRPFVGPHLDSGPVWRHGNDIGSNNYGSLTFWRPGSENDSTIYTAQYAKYHFSVPTIRMIKFHKVSELFLLTRSSIKFVEEVVIWRHRA